MHAVCILAIIRDFSPKIRRRLQWKISAAIWNWLDSTWLGAAKSTKSTERRRLSESRWTVVYPLSLAAAFGVMSLFHSVNINGYSSPFALYDILFVWSWEHLTVLFFVLGSPVGTSRDFCSCIDSLRLNRSWRRSLCNWHSVPRNATLSLFCDVPITWFDWLKIGLSPIGLLDAI